MNRMMRNGNAFLGGLGILWIIAIISMIVGWFINLFEVIGFAMGDAAWADITVMMGLKLVGIFIAPLGGILGLFA